MKQKALFCILLVVVMVVPALAAGGEKASRVWVMGGGERGWLGIQIRDLNEEELARQGAVDEGGVFVEEITVGSPAEKANLRKGDVIVRYADIAVLGREQFVRMVRETAPGRVVRIDVLREGQKTAVKAVIGKRDMAAENVPFAFPEGDLPEGGPMLEKVMPEFEEGDPMFRYYGIGGRPRLGIAYYDLTDQLAKFLGAPDSDGVLVSSVEEGSAAAKAGLKAGDIIVEVGGDRIQGGRGLRRALADKEGALKIRVVRQGKKLDLTAELDKPEKKERRKGQFSM